MRLTHVFAASLAAGLVVASVASGAEPATRAATAPSTTRSARAAAAAAAQPALLQLVRDLYDQASRGPDRLAPLVYLEPPDEMLAGPVVEAWSRWRRLRAGLKDDADPRSLGPLAFLTAGVSAEPPAR
jgi:hypothetical protein